MGMAVLACFAVTMAMACSRVGFVRLGEAEPDESSSKHSYPYRYFVIALNSSMDARVFRLAGPIAASRQ